MAGRAARARRTRARTVEERSSRLYRIDLRRSFFFFFKVHSVTNFFRNKTNIIKKDRVLVGSGVTLAVAHGAAGHTRTRASSAPQRLAHWP